MKILCYCTGSEYFRLNFPSFIASVREVYGDVPVKLAAYQVSPALIRKAKRLYPSLTVRELRPSDNWSIVHEDDDFLGPNKELLASAKTLPWKKLYEEHAEAGDELLLCDVDVVHLRSVERYFRDDFDVAYTYYSTPHPVAAGPDPSTMFGPRLNSGVILAKAGPGARAFFRRWEQLTRRVRPPLSFGGHDQDSLAWLLTGQSRRGRIRSLPKRVRLSIGRVPVRIQGYPCKELNEPEAIGRIRRYTHILHFKGEWKPLLQHGWKAMRGTLRDEPFASEQYEVWRRMRSQSGLVSRRGRS